MEKANSTIEELINIIISLRKEKDKDICCCPESVHNKELCIHDCKQCTEDYYKKIKNEMMQKYTSKE